MPTNRSKIKRVFCDGASDIASWIKWNCSILKYCCPEIQRDNPWTVKTSSQFWKKNRNKIMKEYETWAKNRKWFFTRPEQFFYELEEIHPRKVKRIKSWGPWTKDGAPKEPEYEEVYEDDEQYLTRLGLLFDFEAAITKKRVKTSKKGVAMDENGLETAKIELETKNKDNE
jgi:hypothetical protein